MKQLSSETQPSEVNVRTAAYGRLTEQVTTERSIFLCYFCNNSLWLPKKEGSKTDWGGGERKREENFTSEEREGEKRKGKRTKLGNK